MTIDQEDHAPRPADDFMAHCIVYGFSHALFNRISNSADWQRYYGFLKHPGRGFNKECHQLGCEFSELPHC